MNRQAFRIALATATMLAGGAGMTAPVAAQTSTATLRGQVRDAAGAAVPGATITVTSTATNQTYRATASANGSYVVNGLRPGPFRIVATAANGTRSEQLVTIAIGQSATVDIVLAAPAAAADASGAEVTAGAEVATAPPGTPGDIVVTGRRLVETRTSEVATNISQEQIRILPQTDRNFLSFAALAPGVKYNDSETDKGFRSGASTASQVNVFTRAMTNFLDPRSRRNANPSTSLER